MANVQDSKMLYAKFKVDTYTVEAYTQHGNNAPFDKAGKVSFDNNKYASKVTTTVNRNGEVTFMLSLKAAMLLSVGMRLRMQQIRR